MSTTERILNICLQIDQKILGGGLDRPVVYSTAGVVEYIKNKEVILWKKPKKNTMTWLLEKGTTVIVKRINENIQESGNYQLSDKEKIDLERIVSDSLDAMFYRDHSSHRHSQLLGTYLKFFRANTKLAEVLGMNLREATDLEQYRQRMYYLGFAFYASRAKLAMELGGE